jgi:hypothetical protein
MSFQSLSFAEIASRLYEIRRLERGLLVEFLEALGEMEERRGFLEMGFPSLFSFCTGYLGLSNAAAFRRTTAARMLRDRPEVREYLADGRLSLTTLVLLRDVMDEPGVLDRAAAKNEDQVKLLVASLRPRPDVPPLFRRLPATRTESPPDATSLPAPRDPAASAEATPPAAGASGPERPRARLEPLSEDRRLLRVTVDADFAEKLARVAALLSHRLEAGRLEQVLRACVETTLEVLEKRQRGVGRAPTKPPRTDSRYVPKAVRREVWGRDGARCTFTAGGQRCPATHRLQLHHLHPYGLGGSTTADNLTLRCQGHNLMAARHDYGAEVVGRRHEAVPRPDGGRGWYYPAATDG